MKHLKVGVRLESLVLPLRRALAEASKMGVAGVQIDAAGDLAPKQLSQSGRREFRTLLRVHNLELTALGCPLRRGLDVAENQQPRIDHVRDVMTLAYDLGPRVVIIEPGQVPEKEDEPRARLLREALTALGQHGDRTGTTLALETGLEAGHVLAAYLASFDTGGLAANLDPANLLLRGFDPIQSARDLRGRIAHGHARDARKGSASRAAVEVPLGHGDIDWLTYLETLEEIEYRGWLAVERESGDNRLADVAAGVAFLRRFIA
jgi:sugar phosphate isomerase/epimerase